MKTRYWCVINKIGICPNQCQIYLRKLLLEVEIVWMAKKFQIMLLYLSTTRILVETILTTTFSTLLLIIYLQRATSKDSKFNKIRIGKSSTTRKIETKRRISMISLLMRAGDNIKIFLRCNLISFPNKICLLLILYARTQFKKVLRLLKWWNNSHRKILYRIVVSPTTQLRDQKTIQIITDLPFSGIKWHSTKNLSSSWKTILISNLLSSVQISVDNLILLE